MRQASLLLICGMLLAGCEQLGIEDPAKVAAAKEAEGRAIGSACRQSGRALEGCYSQNKKVSKAAIFSGWRDMDAYMRENNIPEIRTGIASDPPRPEKTTPDAEAAPEKKSDRGNTPSAPKAGSTHSAIEPERMQGRDTV